MQRPTTLIDLFTVPAGRDDEFTALYREVNGFMRQQPGFLGYRLHRADEAEHPYRYVNVATWADRAAFTDAHGEEFRSMLSRPQWREFRSTPGLFEIVSEHRVAGVDA